ncbi:MAG: PAS domain S-box protein [Bacteroidota bacterium]
MPSNSNAADRASHASTAGYSHIGQDPSLGTVLRLMQLIPEPCLLFNNQDILIAANESGKTTLALPNEFPENLRRSSLAMPARYDAGDILPGTFTFYPIGSVAFHASGSEETVFFGESTGTLLRIVRNIPSSETNANLADSINDLIYQIDTSLNLVAFNKAFGTLYRERLGSYPVPGMNVKNLGPNSDPAASNKIRDLIFRAFKNESFTETVEKGSGQDKEFSEISFSPVLGQNQEVTGILIVSRDVSSKMRFAKALEESENRWSLALEAHADGVFDWDLNSDYTWYSPRCLAILGFGAGEFGKSIMDFENRIHPDDRQRTIDAIQAFINNITTGIAGDFRLLHRKGHYVQVHAGCMVSRNVEGKAERLVCILRDVTDERELQNKMRISKENLRAVLENTDDGIWTIDLNYELLTLNAVAAGEFSKGGNIDPAVGMNALTLHHGHNADFWKEHYDRAFNSEKHSFETSGVSATGDLLVFEIMLNPIIGPDGKISGASVVGRDISERKQNEILLRNSEEFNKSIFEKSATGISIVTEPGFIEEVNIAFARIFNYEPEELIGQPYTKLFETNMSEIISGAHRAFMRGEIELKGEFTAMRKDGSPVTILMEAVRLKLPTGEQKGSTFVTDISERKRAEEDLRDLTRQLQRQNAELQQFAYITSHNLRAPVVNLVSLLDFYDHEKEVSELNRAIVTGFAESAGRLNATLNDLLHVTDIRNRTDVEKERIVFAKVFNEVISLLDDKVKLKGAKITHDFELVPEILFPPDYIRDIFIQLIDNALKFTPADRSPVISVYSEYSDGYVVLCVSDNGSGIDLKRHRSRLFGLYDRLHDNAEGKGLGLYLIRSYAETLGGYADVESIPGKGSTFKVYIKNRSPHQFTKSNR